MGAQVYDTGLDVPQRTAVRSAIVAKLQPLLKANGLYMRGIAPLARPYRGAGDDAGLVLINMALQGRAPAVLVALGAQRFKEMDVSLDTITSELEVVVYAVGANPRAMDDGRLAPDVTAMTDVAADPGIETMLEHIRQLLLKVDLDVNGVYELQLVEETDTFTGAEITVFEQSYRVRCDVAVDPNRALKTSSIWGPTIPQVATSILASNNLDGADPANPIAQSLTTLKTEDPPEDS